MTTAKLDPLLATLGKQVDDAFSRTALAGATRALADESNPLRLNFFCTAMRILLEHRLDISAPIADVARCSWFVPVSESGHPSRGQRVKYAIQGGFSDDFVQETLDIDTKALSKKVTGTVGVLGKHVHGNETSLTLDSAVQDQTAAQIVESAEAYFGAIAVARATILEPIKEALDTAAVDALLAETIVSIDELATHHSVDGIYIDSISVNSIQSGHIIYTVDGTISVGLQWGSNSDLRNGDGAEIDENFPFQCHLKMMLDTPWNVADAEISYTVDTSSWYGEEDIDIESSVIDF